MARAYLSGQVEARDGSGIKDAAVYVYTDEAGLTLATLFAAKTGGSALTQPLTSDANGSYAAFVSEPGTFYVRSTDNSGSAVYADNPHRHLPAFTSALKRVNVQLDPSDEATLEGFAAHRDATAAVGNPHSIQEYVATRVTKAVIDALGIDAAEVGGMTAAELQTAITAAIVDSAPGTLDTLNELAAALADDPNFATTLTNLIATKAADNAVVHLAGSETLTGAKTFDLAPIFKLGPHINVKGYGATGDGVTDDHAAITNAIAAVPAAGGVVYFPPGTYKVGSYVFIRRSNVKLIGELGATLMPMSGVEYVLHIGEQTLSTRYENVEVEGLKFYDDDPDAHVDADETHAIIVRNMDHVRIHHNVFDNFGDEYVDVQGSTDTIVESNFFDGGPQTSAAGGALSAGAGCRGVVFRDNHFVGNVTTLGNAIKVESGASDTSHVLIEGNTIENWPETPISVTVGASPRVTSHVSVLNNQIYSPTKRAVHVSSSSGTVEHIVILGNKVDGGGSGAGTDEGAIHLSVSTPAMVVAQNLIDAWGAGSTTKHGIVAQGGVLFENVVLGCGDGIRLQTAGETLVSSNQLRDCTAHGVNLISTSDYNLVIGNNVKNCIVGIEAQSGSDNNIIRANRVTDCTSQGIRFRGTQYVIDNFLKSNAVGLQNVSGSGAFAIGNIFLSNTTDVSGTITTRRRSIGLVDENSGATSVADGGTITHGLRTTPTTVRCTPSVAGEMVAVTAVGATTFTVAIKKHDNTAGTTQTVYWNAEV